MPSGWCAEASTGVLSYPLAFAPRAVLWSSRIFSDATLLPAAVRCRACATRWSKFLWLARGFVARLASEVTLGSAVLFPHPDDMRDCLFSC